jgi:hypothetical protein
MFMSEGCCWRWTFICVTHFFVICPVHYGHSITSTYEAYRNVVELGYVMKGTECFVSV